jgi:hypothetical protein
LYKRTPSKNPGELDDFVEYKRVVLRDIPEFDKVVMEFFFSNDNTCLIFAKKDQVFSLNIESEAVIPIHEMKSVHFKLPPSHFEVNDD